jgi:basic amino acid/polyamine antiporter, APA family
MPLREAPLHDGTLVALVSRRAGVLVPTGSTILEEGDRLTILGGPAALERIRDGFGAD